MTKFFFLTAFVVVVFGALGDAQTLDFSKVSPDERTKVRREQNLLGRLAEGGAAIGSALRGAPSPNRKLIKLFNEQQELSGKITTVREQLFFGQFIAAGDRRDDLLRKQDVLFAETFAAGLKIDRRARAAGPTSEVRKLLNKQRRLAIKLISTAFIE